MLRSQHAGRPAQVIAAASARNAWAVGSYSYGAITPRH